MLNLFSYICLLVVVGNETIAVRLKMGDLRQE